MVNGVAHAFLDRSPLIAITDAYSLPVYETGLRQRLNQLAIFQPIVKWSTTIDAVSVRQQVRRAIRTPPPPRPAPCTSSPQSEAMREAGDYAAEPPLVPNWIVPGPDRADLKPALDMLGRSRRPILIAGLGVYWCQASAELVAFAERLGAPVLTTTKCKGMIPEIIRARRLHHRGPDRAQAGDGGRPDRDGRARRGGVAAQTVALRFRCWPFPRSPERRRARSGRSGDSR